MTNTRNKKTVITQIHTNGALDDEFLYEVLEAARQWLIANHKTRELKKTLDYKKWKWKQQ